MRGVGTVAVLAMLTLSSLGWSAEDRGGTRILEARSEAGPGMRAADPGGSAAIEPVVARPAVEDPCTAEVVSTPSRPVWTGGAQTTQCGVLENDLGWQWEPLGGALRQWMLPWSARYGLTPRMDVRWALPTDVVQSGGEPLTGVSDQSLSVTYRFVEQGRWRPALAASYGFKVPTASAAKGLGTGYGDHQVVLLVSRDVRKLHFDFNAVEILAGAPEGHDEALQMGLVMGVPVAGVKGLTCLLESDGGAQPGMDGRFGQALGGFSWAVRPALVFDAAYTHAITAGTPQEQMTVGVTVAHRPFPALPKSWTVARILGR